MAEYKLYVTQDQYNYLKDYVCKDILVITEDLPCVDDQKRSKAVYRRFIENKRRTRNG